MKRVTDFAMVLVLTLMLSACASTHGDSIRTLTMEETANTLIIGKTSKDEVRSAFGNATVTHYEEGREVWLYQYQKTLPKVVDYIPVVGFFTSSTRNKDAKELTILFNKNGIVKNFHLRLASADGN
jgi:outer membrane protein assembly factor BamE (lipoprotein component of BamABCDE complex)